MLNISDLIGEYGCSEIVVVNSRHRSKIGANRRRSIGRLCGLFNPINRRAQPTQPCDLIHPANEHEHDPTEHEDGQREHDERPVLP